MPNDAAAATPDELEALSQRYGNSAVIVLPLRSGRFAIFDRGFALHSIQETAPDADKLRSLALYFSQRLRTAVLTAEARFYGEPSDNQFRRDLTRIRRSDEAQTRTSLPTATADDLGDI